MKLLLTLIAGLALATSAYAEGGCGGGSCDGKKGEKGEKDTGSETATMSIVIE